MPKAKSRSIIVMLVVVCISLVPQCVAQHVVSTTETVHRKIVDSATNASGGDAWAEVIRILGDKGVDDPNRWPPSSASTQLAYFLLGKAYQGMKKWDLAAPWYQRYLDATPTGIYAEDCKARLGETRLKFWDQKLVEIHQVLANPALTPEIRYTNARAVIAVMKSTGRPELRDEAEILYAEAVVEAGVQHAEQAVNQFQDYKQRFPSGPRLDSVLLYLAQLNRPCILYVQGNLLKTVLEDGSEPKTLTASIQGEVEQAVLSPGRDYAAVLTLSAGTQTRTMYVINLYNPSVAPKMIWNYTGGDSVGAISWAPSLDFPRKTSYLAFVGPDNTTTTYAIWTWDINSPDQLAKKQTDSDTERPRKGALAFSWAPEGTFMAFCAGDGGLHVSQAPFVVAQPVEAVVSPSNLTWALGVDKNPILVGLSLRGIFVIGGKAVSAIANGAPIGKEDVRILDRISKNPIQSIGISSDGDVIGVLRRQTGTDSLELYSVKDQQMLGVPVADVKRYAFSPVGSRLAYQTAGGIFLCRLDNDRGHDVMLSGTDKDCQFAWSPAGNQVLWWRRDRVTLCFDRAQLGAGHLKESAELSGPKWAIDDRAVAIQKVAEGKESIVILDRRGVGTPQTVRQLVSADAGGARLVDWLH